MTIHSHAELNSVALIKRQSCTKLWRSFKVLKSIKVSYTPHSIRVTLRAVAAIAIAENDNPRTVITVHIASASPVPARINILKARMNGWLIFISVDYT